MREVEDLRAFREHFARHGAEGALEHAARTGMARNEKRMRQVYEALKNIFEPPAVGVDPALGGPSRK